MNKIVGLLSLTGMCLVLAMLGNNGSCSPKEGATMKAPIMTNDKLANGVWGGQHVRAEVTNAGAQLEFDCAQGTIDQSIALDDKRSFDIKGKFAAEHAGPIRRDEEGNSRAVRYVGQVKDEVLTLTISDFNTRESLGTFTLTHGSEGRLMKCK